MEEIARSRAKILGSIEEVDGHPTLRVAVGRVPLNSAAAAILSLCDGSRDPDQIVANIVTQRRGISAEDARGFLETAKKLGWINS
jgi:pyrroloquinoline quinone biosynthesis protein D